MSVPRFTETLAQHGVSSLQRSVVNTLQVNIGRRCDLACHHCHVEAGPRRTERMEAPTARRVLELLESNPQVEWLDLTGGAPELHDQFRPLVEGARALDRRVIDRCNLTVLYEPGQEDTADFLATHEVKIVASLPCYTRENVDRQRGRNVFDRSIEALRWLNRLGYGRAGSALELDLVYNPQDASLPPDQVELEARYRIELDELFGLRFHRLIAITNMPIKRFARTLAREGRHEAYLSLLVNHFNPRTVPGLMCRHMLSVGYDGRLYDCDFNQMLELPLGQGAATLWDVSDLTRLEEAAIATAPHCHGCTAGSGSSCGGALS
jgi:radical SAM/Cys-rich protein